MTESAINPDIVIGKVQSIQRCIARAREEYRLAGSDFENNFSRQDAAILNVTRACEQAIDLANHVIRVKQLGVPASSAESFSLLARAGLLAPALERQLVGMVGFRNIAVHEYQVLDMAIVRAVLQQGLQDLMDFTAVVVKLAAP